MLKLSSLLFGVLASWVPLLAQQAIAPVGGSTAGLTYTVGQVAYTSATNDDLAIMAGVQQPYEIYELVSATESFDLPKFEVFPNPASDQVHIHYELPASEEWQYQLTDMQGQLLDTSPLQASKTQVLLDTYPAGVYLLTIQAEDRLLATYKIIKN